MNDDITQPDWTKPCPCKSCTLHDHEKKTIRQSNTDINIFKEILEFKTWCLLTFICLHMAYLFCVMCFIPTYRFMGFFSVKQVHTFILLNMFCQYIVLNVLYVKFPTKKCYTAIPTEFQQSTFSQWAQVQNILIWIYTISLGQLISLVRENKKSPFIELNTMEKWEWLI